MLPSKPNLCGKIKKLKIRPTFPVTLLQKFLFRFDIYRFANSIRTKIKSFVTWMTVHIFFCMKHGHPRDSFIFTSFLFGIMWVKEIVFFVFRGFRIAYATFRATWHSRNNFEWLNNIIRIPLELDDLFHWRHIFLILKLNIVIIIIVINTMATSLGIAHYHTY